MSVHLILFHSISTCVLFLLPSAVDLDGGTGDVARGLRRQKEHDRCHLLRSTRAPERYGAHHTLLLLARQRLIALGDAGVGLGEDEARHDRVDPNAEGPQVFGEL